MKSKISLIILVVIIIFLGAATAFLGYYYGEQKEELEALTAKVNELTQVPEVDGDVVVDETPDITTQEPTVTEVEKLVIAKFDSSKVDNSARTNMTNVEESASTVTMGDITYRKGPKKSITSSSIYDVEYQVRYKNATYTLSDTANIVDVRMQNSGVSSINYMIVLLDDGTIKYSKVEYEGTTLEFKDYTAIKDAVALVTIGSTNGRAQVGVGAITSDGVTHVLPYELP